MNDKKIRSIRYFELGNNESRNQTKIVSRNEKNVFAMYVQDEIGIFEL